MAKNFKNRLKTFMVSFMIVLFFGQAAIACACAYEKVVPVDHHSAMDHSQMNHHDMMGRDQCDEPCAASTLEINKADFSVNYDHTLKIDQKYKFNVSSSVSYTRFDEVTDGRFIKIEPRLAQKSYNNSLYSQAVLLRI